MSRYSTILFDLDHTLFDSDQSEIDAFRQAMCAGDIEDPEQHFSTYQKINLALWAEVERGETLAQQVRTRRFERLVETLDLEADPNLLADVYVEGLGMHGELYAGALEVLQHLAASSSLALVTNGLGEVQRMRIERLKIADFFDAVAISAEIGAAKPGTEIFDVVFRELGGPEKESTLMVGDSLSSDIRGGANYGIATCWYNPKQNSAQASDQIDHEISSLDQLVIDSTFRTS